MLRILIVSICLMLSACEVGDFPEERLALHNKNVPNCEQTPERCHNGIPW